MGKYIQKVFHQMTEPKFDILKKRKFVLIVSNADLEKNFDDG